MSGSGTGTPADSVGRVTAAEVREIITGIDTVVAIDPHILIANQLVTEILSTSGLGDARLKEIERWLAAHFVTINARREEQMKVGDASVKYNNKMDLGLDATLYGQQVKVLDTTGKLTALGKKRASGSVATTVGDD